MVSTVSANKAPRAITQQYIITEELSNMAYLIKISTLAHALHSTDAISRAHYNNDHIPTTVITEILVP